MAEIDYQDFTVSSQNQKVFDIYNIYRLVLSLILLLSFVLGSPTTVLGAYNKSLFIQASSLYTILNFLVLIWDFLPRSRPRGISQFLTVLITDIIILVVISNTCGGVSSGMAHLLIVPIAAGSLLIPGKLSIFLAAVGSISVIYSEVYLYFTVNESNDFYVQAGLLGLTLFVTSLAIQLLGDRIRRNELIAEEQEARIRSLQEMNDRIIQRMRTGIIVVNARDEIVNCNSSGLKMLMQEGAASLHEITLPAPLEEQLDHWRQYQSFNSVPFRLADEEPMLQASFAYLVPGSDSNTLIFLEDYSSLTSLVQQLKLVSLGRLTASIAHEIRNPLGAISHATQLLDESSPLDKEGQRLLDIIMSHCKRVNGIIENIMQLSRNNGDVPERIDLAQWLQQFVGKYRQSRGEPVSIEVVNQDETMTVRFNPSQLEQLMTNLCDNGLRYSFQACGEWKLTIACGVNPGNACPFMEISDEGPAISREAEEQIFEPFYTTESEGTGLGLYICREICEANQAQILYLRNSHGTSTFRINFAHPDRNVS